MASSSTGPDDGASGEGTAGPGADQGDEGRVGGVLGLLARPAVRLTILAVVLIAALVLVQLGGGLSQQGVTETVDAAGIWAPLVYVALYAVLTVALVPGSVFTAAGRLLFGVVAATGLTLVGATAGATVAFVLARRLGREQVERLAGRRLGRLDAWLERRGLLAVLYLRLIPVFPFNVTNYVVGVTGVRLRDYVVGTAIGMLPGTFAYAAVGGNLDDPTSPAFIGAAALLLVLAIGAPLVERRMRRSEARSRDDDPEDPGVRTRPGR